MIPSAEQVASCNPRFFGPNLTSVTLVLESTRFVRRVHFFTGPEVKVRLACSPIVSSQTDAVRSNEQVANTEPNSVKNNRNCRDVSWKAGEIQEQFVELTWMRPAQTPNAA